MQIVHAFAEALDRDDYEAALRLLETSATYQRDSELVNGASAIVESFRNVSEWGHGNLNALEFYHEIDDETSPLEISFIDILRSDGEELRIQHSVFVEVSEAGLIRRLSFTRPAGEKEILSAFFRRHGLTPPGSE